MVPGLILFRGAFSAHRDGIAELLLPLCDDRNKLHRPDPLHHNAQPEPKWATGENPTPRRRQG